MSFFKDESDDETSLAPDQQAQLYQSLAQKYGAAGDGQAVKDAESAASRTNIASLIGQAVSGYGADMARARGVNVADKSGFFGDLRKGATDKVTAAKQARKDAQSDFLTQDELGQKAVTRGREDTEWKRKDEQFGRDETQRQSEEDPASPESKNAQALAKKLMPQGDFTGMSAAKLKASLPHLEKLYGAEQQRLGRIDAINLRNADRAATKAEKDAEKETAASKKEEDYQASVKVDGANVQPGFRPTVQDADKVKKAKAARDAISSQLGELRSLYKGSGTNLVGDDAARQSQIVSDIKIQVKDLAALGALSASDLQLLEDQIPDPTAWGENLKGFAGQDRFTPKADQFQKSIDTRYNTSLGAYGYKPQEGEGNVVMIDLNGKRMNVPASKAKMAEDKGWKRADAYVGK